MTLANNLKSDLESCRAIAGQLGLRPHQVFHQITTNSNSEAAFGYGTSTTTENQILIDGWQNPKVIQLSNEEVIASGGIYSSQDLKVGPLTPASDDDGPGYELSPSLTAGTSIRFRVTGPGIPNCLYSLVQTDFDSALSYYLILRKI